jgi:hypothetical protein
MVLQTFAHAYGNIETYVNIATSIRGPNNKSNTINPQHNEYSVFQQEYSEFQKKYNEFQLAYTIPPLFSPLSFPSINPQYSIYNQPLEFQQQYIVFQQEYGEFQKQYDKFRNAPPPYLPYLPQLL